MPIEAGQTISQPFIVGRMIEAAAIAAGDRVLEIGAGSGYAAAVLSRIAGQVHAVERHEELTRLAAERLQRLGYANVALARPRLGRRRPFDSPSCCWAVCVC